MKGAVIGTFIFYLALGVLLLTVLDVPYPTQENVFFSRLAWVAYTAALVVTLGLAVTDVRETA